MLVFQNLLNLLMLAKLVKVKKLMKLVCVVELIDHSFYSALALHAHVKIIKIWPYTKSLLKKK